MKVLRRKPSPPVLAESERLTIEEWRARDRAWRGRRTERLREWQRKRHAEEAPGEVLCTIPHGQKGEHLQLSWCEVPSPRGGPYLRIRVGRLTPDGTVQAAPRRCFGVRAEAVEVLAAAAAEALRRAVVRD